MSPEPVSPADPASRPERRGGLRPESRLEFGEVDDVGAASVTGDDATSYLQSLVSADLDPVGPGSGVHSLLLSPQGKLDVDFTALCIAANEWLLLVERRSDAARLTESLARFKIRVDVDISDCSDIWARLSVRGRVDALEAILGAPVPTEHLEHAAIWDDLVVRLNRDGLSGADVLATSPQRRSELVAALRARGDVDVGAIGIDAMRVRAGIPRSGSELDDSVIAQEASLERDAVSFTKGCFLGQELVCRIDVRGRVNRFLRYVHTAEAVVPGAIVLDGEREVGTVTSAIAGDGHGPPLALAYVHRTVEPGVAVTVRSRSTDLAGTVAALPGSEEPRP